MIGRRVAEVCFFTSISAFWFGFAFIPQEFFEVFIDWKTVLSNRDTLAVIFAAILMPFVGVLMLIVNGEEKLTAEVLKPYGLVIVGMLLVGTSYFVLVDLFLIYSPRSYGVIARVVNLSISSSFSLSIIVSIVLMLSGFGVYLVGQGILAMFLSFIKFARKFI